MNINKIIKEEHNNLLIEGYIMEHDNFKFNTEVKEVSFYNYQNFSNDFDVDIEPINIFLSWRIGFHLDTTGIEKFLIQGDKVEGEFNVKLYDKQTDELSQEINKNINDISWKFNIYSANLKLHDSLYVESLDFDFKTKICTITFYETNN